MSLFGKKAKVAPLNKVGQELLGFLQDQDLICAVLNSACIVDLGNMAIQTENFPNCDSCLEKFGESDHPNLIPDCASCGRNEKTAINIRSGVGDGVYPILGLCNTNWVEMGEIPPFKGFIVDFRQDMPNFYLEKAITKRGFADINLSMEDILNGVEVVNFGSISSKGRLYVSDILATSAPGPVVCDVVCERGDYNLYAVLDYMHEPSNPMPKLLIGIKKEFATNFEKAYPFNKDAKDARIAKWSDAAGFFLTGDHKSQCYGLNYWIAENSARYFEAASWLLLGAEVGDPQSLKQLEEGINFELNQSNAERVISQRLP